MLSKIFARRVYIFSIVVITAFLVGSLGLSQGTVLAQDNPFDRSNTEEPTLEPTATELPGLLGVDVTTVPTLVSPSGTISDSTPSYKWTKITGATQYSFTLYKSTSTIYSKTLTASTCGSSATYCVSTPITVLADASYTWKVRAYVGGVWKAYSPVKTFKLVTIPVLSSPAATISDSTPTFKWTRIVAATQYSFTLYKGTATVYTKTVPTASCGASTTYCVSTPTTALADAPYSWKVRALIGGIWKAYSPVKAFKLVTIPTLSSPAGTIADSTPTYRWTRIVAATQYSYTLYKGSTTVYSKSVPSASCGSSTTYCSTTPSTELVNGSYSWKVRANVGGAWKTYSTNKTFIVNTNPFTGTGLLDGGGIPPDFFADVHIRKAFSYAFNWDTYIQTKFYGSAVQSLELPMPGMIGYDASAQHYSFDKDKAIAEFKLADLDKDGIPAGKETDGSDIWNLGFFVKIYFNEGNDNRQNVAKIFADNLLAINRKFVVIPIQLTGPQYNNARRDGQLPLLAAGWLEDIHDPHNWYQSYTVGTYSSIQHMPEDLKNQFATLVTEGVSTTDPVDRASIYHQLNQMYFDNVPGVPLALTVSHIYEQRWMSGRIQNPLFGGVYYYGLSKNKPSETTSSVYAAQGGIDTLDPALAYDTISGQPIQNIYETLVFYEGEKTDTFMPQLAESWNVSADGKTWTFHIRSGVKFHNGDTLKASDVAYTFQRGLLQGGSYSPQWLLMEPFFGPGTYDVSELVDSSGALLNDRGALQAADATALVNACNRIKTAIVADDVTGTVTFNLTQAWGPLLATLANTWGSIMDKQWIIDNNGWNDSCNTWQNYYAMSPAEDPFTPIANGTGPYSLSKMEDGNIFLTANSNYWRTTPAYTGGPAGIPSITNVEIRIVSNKIDRYNMLSMGSADYADLVDADDLVGENCDWNNADGRYVCSVANDHLLRLYRGRPNITNKDVIIYNFDIQ